jgi:glycosyltransferase involved in cell wall biosynthesis
MPYSIVYVATLGRTSDFEDLLEPLASVCRQEPRCTVNIVGDGDKREQFELRAKKLGVEKQFVFHGRVPHEKLPALISRFQIGVNYMRPGLVNDCRAILKIREYLALGLQVVCNNTGDASLFSKFIHIGNSPEDIAEQLRRLLKKSSLKKGGSCFINKNFSWKWTIKQFRDELFRCFYGETPKQSVQSGQL